MLLLYHRPQNPVSLVYLRQDLYFQQFKFAFLVGTIMKISEYYLQKSRVKRKINTRDILHLTTTPPPPSYEIFLDIFSNTSRPFEPHVIKDDPIVPTQDNCCPT